MSLLKKILLFALIFILLICVGSYFYIQSFRPDYNAEVAMTGLTDEVEVYYDAYGIPHIYANTQSDLFRSFGYIHAKDRLWQMELLRRIAPGKLSEIFGEGLIETDKLFRMMGLNEYSKQSLEYFENDLSPEIRQNALAYIDGINQYMEHGKAPIEFKILGIKPTPYSPIDLYNIMGYMAFSFAIAHETDPLASFILDKHGPSYLNDLMLHVDSSTTMIRSHFDHDQLEEISMHVGKITKTLPAPEFIGSNSWVIGGEKTKSGKVIFANDPHIGFSSPSVWYEAFLSAPGFENYGYFLGGFPFPHLTHNSHHAMGMTMLENDDIDFFVETQNPSVSEEYQYKGEWKKYKEREEVIQVKGGDDVRFTVRSTVHGPIMNDAIEAIKTANPVSMWWSYVHHTNTNIDASYRLATATNVHEAALGAELIHGPGLNIMYGDVDGNVAWWASAKLVKRPDHVNSKLLLEGESGDDDPIGSYDFAENPKAINPPWNYVYSANNQPIVEGYPLHPGYYLPEDRARRIVKILEAKNDWTVDEVKEMITDVQSENAPEIAGSITTVLAKENLDTEEQKAIELLIDWDGNYTLASKAPVIYNKMLYHITHMAMKDELGEDLFEVYNGNHLMKRSVQPLLANASSPWWDDISTTDISESRKDIFLSALKETVKELKTQFGNDWNNATWDMVHTLEHNHFFSAVPVLKKYFNVGPFSIPGNSETINNFMFTLEDDGTYEVTAGPSTRRIVDFADIEGNSWSILPTGQSGNVLSPHYDDQAEMHSKGEFRRMLMDKEEIKGIYKYKTVLTPK